MRLSVLVTSLTIACASLGATTSAAQKAYVVASDQPAFAEAARAALEALGSDGMLLRADESAKATVGRAEVVIAVGPLAERVVGASIGEE